MRAQETDVGRLREELYRARRTVIDLMPERARQVLDTYVNCSSMASFYEWQNSTANNLLDLCEPWSPRGIEGGSLSPRTHCPLCGGSSNNAYGADGFAFPEGLSRHLLGSHHANPCPVFEMVAAMALEHCLEMERRGT